MKYTIISVRQPWAELIARGLKRFENRSWRTRFRGPILIHASSRDMGERYTIEVAGYDGAQVMQLFGDIPRDPEEMEADELHEMAERVRKAKAHANEIKEHTDAKDDSEFYLVVVFKSYEDRKALTDLFKMEDNRYVESRAFIRSCGSAEAKEWLDKDES